MYWFFEKSKSSYFFFFEKMIKIDLGPFYVNIYILTNVDIFGTKKKDRIYL